MSSKPKPKTETKKKTALKKTASAKYTQEIAELKLVTEEVKDRHLRLKAEFENFRRRKEKEILNLLTYDGEEIIKIFLPVVDDLERLSAATNDKDETNSEKVREGIQLILNKIHKRFSELKVNSFAKSGEILDPNLHDALMIRSEKGKAENEILEVFEKGYRYKDRVIRHAKVVVNQESS